MEGGYPGLTFTSILFIGPLEANFLSDFVLLICAEVNEDALFLSLNEGVVCFSNSFDYIFLFL
jgi:hypothetical protein